MTDKLNQIEFYVSPDELGINMDPPKITDAKTGEEIPISQVSDELIEDMAEVFCLVILSFRNKARAH